MITFHNNLTKAKIANESIMSVQSLSCISITQLSRVLFPGLHVWSNLGCYRLFMCGFRFWSITRNEILFFTITAEIHARSLANFYCQYADRHMNLKFTRRVSERERAIRQFVVVKNKLMSVLNASVLLLIMNFVITLSK